MYDVAAKMKCLGQLDEIKAFLNERHDAAREAFGGLADDRLEPAETAFTEALESLRALAQNIQFYTDPDNTPIVP